jgi:O-acetyl-ADP-ribose deacetylase (regulator of RNase III)
MKFNLIFFDISESHINEYKNTIGDLQQIQVQYIHTNVVDLLENQKIHIIVSPANSLGFMDGGIDIYYMQLFPGIQNTVQDKIRSFGIISALGRPILPIGSAMIVPTKSPKCPLLACVPTMFLPENINGTQNVYWAMRGLLTLLETKIEDNTNLTIAVPCFGTGVGKLSALESATQVKKALTDHINKENMTSIPLFAFDDGTVPKNAYVLSDFACKQPITYANTEVQPDTFNALLTK